MNMRLLSSWFVAAIALSAAGPAHSQEVGGRLDGRITTSDLSPLAGVEVTVTSQGPYAARTVMTNERGRFVFVSLPVGRYRVTARLLGYRALAVSDVAVRLGETTGLPRLVLERTTIVLEELVITAEAAGLQTGTTARRMVLDASQLDALPVDRNFRSILLLASSAVPSFLGSDGGGAGINKDGINVAGATGYENTFYVDGINITSPIRGETSIDLPSNFVHQIQAQTGGATDEDALSLGGAVNVLTRPGGDRMQGQVFGFYASDGLQATPRIANGSYQTGYTFSDVGASLSGPLRRGRLYFSTAYDHNRENREYVYPFGPLATTRRQDLFAGRVTWLLNPRTSAFMTVLGDPTRSTPLAMPLFGNGVPQNAEVLQRSDKATGIGTSLRVQHMLTPRVFLEASVAQMTRSESGVPLTAAGREPIVIDQLMGTLYGGHGFGYDFEGRRRTARAEVSANLGAHMLRSGVQYEALLGDINLDGSRESVGGSITRADTNLYSWHTYRGQNGRGTSQVPSLSLVDTWQINPRVAAVLGMRWSRQSLRALGTTATYPSYEIADGLQPRVGLIVSSGATGTDRVTVSYARAVEQLPVWQFQDFGVGAESLFVFTHDPRVDPTGGSLVYGIPYGAGTPSAKSLRGQAVDQWALGYARSLGATSLSLTIMRHDLRRVVASGNDTSGTFIWGNPGEGEMAAFPRMTRTYDALEATVERRSSATTWWRASYVLSRTRGNYPGLFGSDWRLGFTNAGPMFVSPEQYVDGSGLLPNDRPHVFKAFGSHRFDFGLGLGGNLMIASGAPLTEYGAISIPPPFRGFASQRGTAGRMPTFWDLGVRASYELPAAFSGGMYSRLLLDVLNVGNPRKTVDVEQWHYTCLDGNGNQSCPNASYGQVLQYQPPMSARLGLMIDFGAKHYPASKTRRR